MKATKTIGILLVLALIAWGLLSLGGGNKQVASTEPIKIGVVVSQTGVGSYVGEQSLRGLNLAVDSINSAGGINGRKIELIVEDSKAAPATAVTVLKKLTDIDGVKIVIGDSWNSTTEAMVPVANSSKTLLISPVASLDSLSADDYFFRTIPVTNDMIVPLAEFAVKAGIKKVAILRQNTPFGIEHATDFKKAFEQAGGIIVSEESFDLTTTDYRSQITKVKASNPEAIFDLAATGPSTGLLIKQAKDLGVDVKWFGSYGSENGALVKEYGLVIEGLTYPYPYNGQSDDAAVKTFVAAYSQKYDQTPDFVVANSYDALQVVASAIKQVGADDVSKIKSALLGIRDFHGASGVLSLDQNGDVKKPIMIKQIIGGQFVEVE